MSWIRIPMKFSGICIICNQKIEINEFGLWSKGVGVKHEKCSASNELLCGICGKSAGCTNCEFQESCDIENVSKTCICKSCNDSKNAYVNFHQSILKKYHFS
jgi:hypothetical protein